MTSDFLSDQERRKSLLDKVRPVGFEPTTLGSEDRCAIQLRHGRALHLKVTYAFDAQSTSETDIFHPAQARFGQLAGSRGPLIRLERDLLGKSCERYRPKPPPGLNGGRAANDTRFENL